MSGHLPVMMYGALPYQPREDFEEYLRRLRETATLPNLETNPGDVVFAGITRTEFDSLVARVGLLERGLLALLEHRELTKPKKKKRKAKR